MNTYRQSESCGRSLFLCSCAAALLLAPGVVHGQDVDPDAGWGGIRSVKMSGGLRVFWDVGGANDHRERAVRHGFEPVCLVNDYSDYPGKQKRNIKRYIQRSRGNNPWAMPDYFEEIVTYNIERAKQRPRFKAGGSCLFVHDIEFDFEEDIAKAWADPKVREAGGAKSEEAFRGTYLSKWAEWFWLPCKIGKETTPDLPSGLYGPQPFRRDYWGIAGKDAQQIDGTHKLDAELWKFIDPHVDFYIASIYVFYDEPGSVFYIASNIEENFERTRQFGNKPVYSYSWLRFHNSNRKIGGHELPPWLADATAVVPYFYGARGNVLWGYEPRSRNDKNLYGNLPVYTDSLGRVADLSEKIARATPAPADEPAHVLWKQKRPLLKRLKVSDSEWVVLAANPWQAEDESSELEFDCGRRSVTVTLQGRHCDVFHIADGEPKRLQVDYGRATEPINGSE